MRQLTPKLHYLINVIWSPVVPVPTKLLLRPGLRVKVLSEMTLISVCAPVFSRDESIEFATSPHGLDRFCAERAYYRNIGR